MNHFKITVTGPRINLFNFNISEKEYLRQEGEIFHAISLRRGPITVEFVYDDVATNSNYCVLNLSEDTNIDSIAQCSRVAERCVQYDEQVLTLGNKHNLLFLCGYKAPCPHDIATISLDLVVSRLINDSLQAMQSSMHTSVNITTMTLYMHENNIKFLNILRALLLSINLVTITARFLQSPIKMFVLHGVINEDRKAGHDLIIRLLKEHSLVLEITRHKVFCA